MSTWIVSAKSLRKEAAVIPLRMAFHLSVKKLGMFFSHPINDVTAHCCPICHTDENFGKRVTLLQGLRDTMDCC